MFSPGSEIAIDSSVTKRQAREQNNWLARLNLTPTAQHGHLPQQLGRCLAQHHGDIYLAWQDKLQKNPRSFESDQKNMGNIG